jgi:hypothetical protein
LIGNEFPWPIVAPFVLSVFGATFMQTWIFNGAKGSVLLPMLLHATVNTVGAGLIFPLFSGAPLVLLWWIYGLVWLGTGLGALLFSSNRNVPVAAAPATIAAGFLAIGRVRPTGGQGGGGLDLRHISVADFTVSGKFRRRSPD